MMEEKDLFYKKIIKGHFYFQIQFGFLLIFSSRSKDFSLKNTFIELEFSHANL